MGTLSLRSVKVNKGTVQNSERPLFVGVTKVADSTNGWLVNTSVTIDRDWMWVRFSSKPSESWKAKMITQGFTWSQKREGWHVLLDEHKAKFVQELGALPVTMEAAVIAASAPLPEESKMTLTRDQDIDVDMSEERRSKGKRHAQVEERVKERRTKKAPSGKPGKQPNPEPWGVSPSPWYKHHSKANRRYTRFPNQYSSR